MDDRETVSRGGCASLWPPRRRARGADRLVRPRDAPVTLPRRHRPPRASAPTSRRR